jgi:putative peptide maturation system protein
MNDSLRQAVVVGLDYLQALQRDRVRPAEARALLQAVRARHADLAINLLAEEEAFDQSVHYDLLFRRAGTGTVSLSYCPDRAIPWPLRGVQRWSDAHLVRVNGNVLKVDQAIACLDFIWDEARIIEQLVNLCLMREELEREPINLTDAELQEAMNRFRSARKLFKARDTLQWLERHGMTHESLEQYVSDNALVEKLRDRIAADRVEPYFRQHEGDFDTARVARLEVAEECQARAFAEAIRSGRLDFYPAAERCFLEAAERGASPQGNLLAVIERRQAAPALREQLFTAAPGQLIGPVPAEAGYALFRVLAIVPARLNGRTREVIKNILFDEWLAERRQAARIEWCWGNASKTG